MCHTVTSIITNPIQFKTDKIHSLSQNATFNQVECNAYIFLGVIFYPAHVSAHAHISRNGKYCARITVSATMYVNVMLGYSGSCANDINTIHIQLITTVSVK